MSDALSHLNRLIPIGNVPTFGPRTGARKYEGADRGRRTGSFPLNNLSPNKDIGMDAQLLRQRLRYLYQNTVPAKRSVNALANGIVGTGIIPKIKCKDEALNKSMKRVWDAFTGDDCLCDFYGRLNFAGIEKLVTKTMVRDGEVLILRRRVPVHESPIGIQLQVLEMEYVADYINYQEIDGGGWTYNGIEYDKRGKTVAYWLFQRHPSEWWTQPKRVLVEDIIHVLDVNFAAQNRGVGEGAQTIIQQRDLDEFEDAELMAKKVQASFALFRTTNDPEAIEAADKDRALYDSDDDLERIEPGQIYHLFPGEDIQGFTPPTASGAEEYRKSRYRNIAAGWGVTYEMMTGDYSNVNFSSGRMGWIEHSRTIEHLQWLTLIPQFCNRVMKWFLEQLPLTPGSGIVTLPKEISVSWTAPRREMIDPVKEMEGLKNSIRTGLKPPSWAMKENGDDPDEILAAYAEDYKKWKAAGLLAEWSVNLDPQVTTPQQQKGEK